MERLDEYDNEKEGMDKEEDERSDKNGITIIIHKDKGILFKVHANKMTILLRH